ncbi:heme-binding protein [Pelagibius sp. Alg239-R121]|uniref:GlcG/HbpS family heme-binding protein n=1 Tax=Pelagibius sp. Alg239-R121 TaxID=2993448 RepID=UPI0024A73AF2|nr:heme-binding protein [Pelagibius sp. Alg239-R121]
MSENIEPFVADSRVLTHRGALTMLSAAVDHATKIEVPQCIVIVDRSGEVIASLRMSGAKFLSLRSATAKARTAASMNAATGNLDMNVGMALGLATDGAITPLPGGLPIRFEGEPIGGIGVGSGSGEQDRAVARAALEAAGADLDV